MKANSPDHLLIAEIGAAHGIRGAVKLHHYCESIKSLSALGTLRDENDVCWHFRTLRSGKNAHEVIVEFREVSDRTTAETLYGHRLYASRAQFPEAQADTYYHADLIGLAVYDATNDMLIGHVQALYNFGAGEILDILTPARKELMHPFERAFVPKVDLIAGKITVCGLSIPNESINDI